MSTPEENLDVAIDESNDREARERAIDALQTANDCDALADLVRAGDIERRYRERALDGLAHPQCTSTMESLAEDDSLDASLRERAEELLEETPDDAGPDH